MSARISLQIDSEGWLTLVTFQSRKCCRRARRLCEGMASDSARKSSAVGGLVEGDGGRPGLVRLRSRFLSPCCGASSAKSQTDGSAKASARANAQAEAIVGLAIAGRRCGKIGFGRLLLVVGHLDSFAGRPGGASGSRFTPGVQSAKPRPNGRISRGGAAGSRGVRASRRMP